jgi:FkbM family methyltransferase
MTCYLPEGNTFFYYGYCEANVMNFFLRFVQPRMTILDIGAHVGMYSMLGAELVGRTGIVHSFEPTPRTYALLRKNTHQYEQVNTFNVAVSAKPGIVTFADYGPGYGAFNTAHAAGAQGITRPGTTVRVTSTSLDQHCGEHSLTPTLLKIDAEGFEYDVLLGASTLLSADGARPLITLEVAGGKEWAKNRADTFALLQAAQYLPYTIAHDGTVSPHQLREDYDYDNVLFVPEEKTHDLSPLLSPEPNTRTIANNHLY